MLASCPINKNVLGEIQFKNFLSHSDKDILRGKGVLAGDGTHNILLLTNCIFLK
jgi:hypothetical protein